MFKTISNQNIGEGSFGIVSIGHIKTLDSFVRLRKEDILIISMSYLKQECCKV